MIMKGEILMIVWGIQKGAPSFQWKVGQNCGGGQNLTITKIIQEHLEGGVSEFHIECIQKNTEGSMLVSPFIWKTYKLEPDEITYHLPDEKHNYFKV